MYDTQDHSHSQGTFIFGAVLGAALVALMTTSTGRRIRMHAKDKAREMQSELPKLDGTDPVNPYDSPLTPS